MWFVFLSKWTFGNEILADYKFYGLSSTDTSVQSVEPYTGAPSFNFPGKAKTLFQSTRAVLGLPKLTNTQSGSNIHTLLAIFDMAYGRSEKYLNIIWG